MRNNLLLIFLLALMAYSCEKKELESGIEIQPDSQLKLKTAILNDFATYTASAPALETSRALKHSLLGSVYDDTFGRSSAFVNVQALLSSQNVNFGTNPTIVSCDMSLDLSDVYGNTKDEIHFKFFKSDFEIKSDSAYFSDTDVSAAIKDPIADQQITLDSLTSVKISLNNDFGQKILNTESKYLVDNTEFLKQYKGLHLSVDTNGTNKGLILKVDFTSEKSYIELKYTNDEESETQSFRLLFNEASGRFSNFYNNLNPLNAILNQPSDKVYLAGMAGPRGHISLSPLLNWRDSSDIMIYKAELIAKTDESYNTSTETEKWEAPEYLFLQKDLEDKDEIVNVDDIIVGTTTNYGGKYDSKTHQYSMTITRQVQNLINKNHNDSLLWIKPITGQTKANRVILQNNNTNKIQLVITYSKLK